MFDSAFLAAASGAGGPGMAVAKAAVTASNYFWAVIQGPVAAKVTASLAAGVQLETTTDVTKVFNVQPGDTSNGVRGVSLSAESGGLATVYLF